MTETERAQLARFVATWAKAGPALEEIRGEELRKLDRKGGGWELDVLDELSDEVLPVRTTSGMIEQQRLFRRMRGETGSTSGG